MTHDYKKDKEAGWEFVAALFPIRILGGDKTPAVGPSILMDPATAEERKLFYEALLQLKWIAPKVRYAVMYELSRDLRKEKTQINRAVTITMQIEVAEVEASMRKNEERPSKGTTIRGAAIDEVAERHGLDFDTLKKQFERL